MSEQLAVVTPLTGMELEAPAPRKSARLLSLDVFRGLTIAGMILVNNPGATPQYSPLGHAHWNGWTPTDLVFPSFLFIVGVAMTFAFDRRLAEGFSKVRLMEGVVRRTIILFLLGLIMFAFNNWRLMAPYLFVLMGLAVLFRDEPPLAWPADRGLRRMKAIGFALLAAGAIWWAVDFRIGYFNAAHPPIVRAGTALRVPGVLQRIAICYLVVSVIMLVVGTRGRVLATVAILLGYWWMVKHPWDLPVTPGLDAAHRPEGILHAWVDAKLLGRHVYSELPEPEGIVSTIGGVATCLLGVLTGTWLRTSREDRDKLIGLFFFGNLAIAAGLWMAHSVDINKKIWTSSYVLLAGGIAMNILAMCYWLVDVKGWRKWALPFTVFGTNAILVYFASGLFGRFLMYVRTATPDGQPTTVFSALKQLVTGFVTYPPGSGGVSLKSWLYTNLISSHFPNTDWGRCNASLSWALLYVLFWLILLIPLYRKRLFLKV